MRIWAAQSFANRPSLPFLPVPCPLLTGARPGWDPAMAATRGDLEPALFPGS